MNSKVFLASDHAGYALKEALFPFLKEHGFDVEDVGPFTFDKDDDYPDTIGVLARTVASNPGSCGIAIGMSGQGEAMAANRLPGVRAAVYYGAQPDILKLSREHNNANVLSLSAKFLSVEQAKEAVQLWLSTPFSNETRHLRRIQKLG